MKRFSSTFAVALVCACPGVWQLRGQTTADLTATVQFSNGQSVSIADFSDPIGVQPGEVVSVTIQFAPNHAGEAIKVGSLDGGRVSAASATVGAEGTVTFKFQLTADPGQNRVVVRHRLGSLRMQFWVLGSNNPPVITAVNSGN